MKLLLLRFIRSPLAQLPHSCLQAELAAACGVKEESEDEESDQDDGSSSASSVFGLDKTSSAPTSRRRAVAATPPMSRPRSEAKEAAAPGPGQGNDTEKSERATMKPRRGSGAGDTKRGKEKESPLATAQSALQLLQQISPASQWQGKVKEQDLQSRLKKAGTAIGDVQRFQGTLPADSPQKADCERLLSGLGGLVEAAPLCRDVFCKLKAKQQVMQSLQDPLFQSDLLKVFALDTLDMETASAILSAIAQKVVEAGELGGTGLSHSI